MLTLVKVIIFSRSRHLENEYTYVYNLYKEIITGDYVIVPFGKTNKAMSGIVSKVFKEKENKINKNHKYVIKVDKYLSIGDELVLLIKYFSNRLGINYNIFLNYIFPKLKKSKINDNTIIGTKIDESSACNVSIKTKEFLKFLKKFKFPLSFSTIISGKKYSKRYIYKKSQEGLITTSYIPEYLTDYISNLTSTAYTLFDVQFSNCSMLSYTLKDKNKYYPILLKGAEHTKRIKYYLSYIDNFISEGKTILYLVPEIILTIQIIKILTLRYGYENVAVYHSKLNKKQLEYYWQSIKNNKVKIIIGTRSAIFSPLSNLGLIILDEEHYSSYKQDNIPVYNAREVAVWRAKYNQCTLIFGSQTPSIESYYRGIKDIYKLFNLNHISPYRYRDIKIINMRYESADNQMCGLSYQLQEYIRKKLSYGEQIVLFINRRGYAYRIRCIECNLSVTCKNCGSLLVYYKEENYFLCNTCSSLHPLFTKCKNCFSNLKFLGIGIQKISDYIKKNITDSIIVADSDNIKNYYKVYQDFSQKKYSILIGTKIISKTFNFPNVSLVGVIDIDNLLNFPDFRIREKTYQLLNHLIQLSNSKSKILIQTYNNQRDYYNNLLLVNYEKFISYELKYRKNYCLPPFYNLVEIVLTSSEILINKKFSVRIFNRLSILKNVIIYKPIAKNSCNRSKYIYQIILKYSSNCKLMNNIVKIVKEEERKDSRIRIYVKLNPENLF